MSGKKVDRQLSQPATLTLSNFTSASTSSSSPRDSDKDNTVERVQKPIAPFPNRLRNNNKSMYMEKILEIFNQVKLNVPLLGVIQQNPTYAKFLKDMYKKKRKTNMTKKVFLATNISELLSGLIMVKYRTLDAS